MHLDWQTIFILFFLSIPGISIAIPRLVVFLLRNGPEQTQKRLSIIVVAQMLFMVLVMILAGCAFSKYTQFKAPLLSNVFDLRAQQAISWNALGTITILTGLGTIGFLILYQVIFKYFFSPKTLQILTNIRHSLKLYGNLLYAIPEEILLRYGLFNFLGIFALLLFGGLSPLIQSSIILISGMMYAAAQIPLYVTAGCPSERKLIFVVILLYVYQAALFGFIFIKYGLFAAILSHMIFYCIWWLYDHCFTTSKA